MSLSFEELRAACQKTLDIDCSELGGTVRLRMIPASVGMRLANMLPTPKFAEDGKTPIPPDTDSMLDLFVEVLSESIVNGELKPICNSEDGKKVIRDLPIGSLMRLGQAAMEHSGMAESANQKKT